MPGVELLLGEEVLAAACRVCQFNLLIEKKEEKKYEASHLNGI